MRPSLFDARLSSKSEATCSSSKSVHFFGMLRFDVVVVVGAGEGADGSLMVGRPVVVVDVGSVMGGRVEAVVAVVVGVGAGVGACVVVGFGAGEAG